jgi:hypothetical protein
MQAATLFNLSAAVIAAGMLHAQTPVDPMIEAVPATTGETPALPAPTEIPPVPEIPATPPGPATEPANASPSNPAAAAVPFTPQESAKKEIEKSENGMGNDMTNMQLNDAFLFLAKSVNRQYFHNNKIVGPDFLVTGHLTNDPPLVQMEDLALQFGLTLYTKGNTVFASGLRILSRSNF